MMPAVADANDVAGGARLVPVSDPAPSVSGPKAAAAGSPAKPWQDDPTLASIKTRIERWIDGRHAVDEVRRTPVPGVYEVRVGTEFIYVDEKARYAFIDGDLIDLSANRNLTRERTDEVLAINFKDLPLNLAIKQVHGNGKRILAVFEDPNCGYCRNLRADLAQMDNTTVYTFALPILAADSESKARKALCAPDQAKAWNEMMATGRPPDNPGTCATSHMDQLIALGAKLNVTVTPTLFFTSGKRVRGYVPPRDLEKLLDASTLPPA